MPTYDEWTAAQDTTTVSVDGHDLGGGVFLRYAAHNPDAVEQLVLSNSVAYDSWPIQTITDLGLPETARETSVEELQATLDGLFRDSLYGEGASEDFQSIEWAERLYEDIDGAELMGLDEANHWVMADRPAAYRERLTDFLS